MVDYQKLAREARREVLTLVHKASTSHIASNFSCIDMATVLYENLKPQDRVVWSKGWAAATIYYFLWKQGKITRKQLESFPNPPFLGLAEPSVPGVECSGGAMGHGLPVAVGMALGLKREGVSSSPYEDSHTPTVYCIMSDGEMQEGTTWEAAALAAHNKLDNLVVLIDVNKWCAMGKTEEVVDYEPLDDKWHSFGWIPLRVDGHNYGEVEDKLTIGGKGFPTVLICDTIKGKGVSFFENHLLFHYKHVDDDEYKRAMKELSPREDIDHWYE